MTDPAICAATDHVAGVRCQRIEGHDYPAHSHGRDDGRWYLEWVQRSAAPAAPAEAATAPPTCPHDATALRWVEDQWFCPTCGDEWGREVEAVDAIAGQSEAVR